MFGFPNLIYGHLTSARYQKKEVEDVGTCNTLRVEYSVYGEDYVQWLPNGDFETKNPAIQLMLTIGARPSTIEDIEPSDGAYIPLEVVDGEVVPHEKAIRQRAMQVADSVTWI